MLWKQLNPRYRRLLRNGQRGHAVVVKAEADTTRVADAVSLTGLAGWNVKIRVKLADGRSAEYDRYVEAADIDRAIAPGDLLPIRFDPAKPSRVEIDTKALRADAMPSAESAARAQLEEDERVRDAENRLQPLGAEPPDPDA
jgi:hypothetical protein